MFLTPEYLVNDIQGQVRINGLDCTGKQVATSLKLPCGSRLETLTGRMEVLLTPGLFLRLDENTTVTVQAAATIALLKGKVLRDRVEHGSVYTVSFLNASFSFTGPALLEFDSSTAEMRIYEGEVSVQNGRAKSIFRKGTKERPFSP